MATLFPQISPAPITAYRPHPTLSSIEDPTLEQLHRAACIWDVIATGFNLEYAFVGSIVARLRADDDKAFETNTIEILVRPTTLANGARRLVELRSMNQHLLGFTPTNQLLVITEGNRGIELKFFANRDGYYPEDFIPPNNSSMYTGEYAGLHPTFDHIYLHGFNPSINRYLPFIRCRWLLIQRLFRFDPDSPDQNRIDQNIRDINDIKVFLKCTKEDGDRIPPGTVQLLLPNYRRWRIFASYNCLPPTMAEEEEWVRLGFSV
jgi:hypothetical protein